MNEFKFLLGLGVSLSCFGFVPSNFSLTPTSAIYSIDGQTPIPFLVPALSAANARQLYNQAFFKTVTLSPGQHELIVTYQGNSGTAPLALDYFIVQNATSSSATSALTSVPGATSATSSSVPSSSSSNSTSNLDSKKSPLVGIIVGVVGGVIALVLLLLLYNRRRNNLRAQKLKENSNPEPFTLSPQSYTSEVRSFQVTPQPSGFSSKFSQRREPAQAGTSISTPSPVIGERISPITPAIRNTETMSLMQPSTSALGSDLGFLQHAVSGVRMMPHAQGNLVELVPRRQTTDTQLIISRSPSYAELPPAYTSS